MILLSVGTQLPFDRLVKAVDDWARDNAPVEVVAQIGPSHYQPHTLKAFPFLGPEAFLALQVEAELHVSHAGMGSILTAMQHGKPIIIMPRDHGLGEHRNSHQFATARRFAEKPGVHVCMDVAAVKDHLSRRDLLTGGGPISPVAPAAFTSKLRDYLDGPPG